VRWKRGLRGLSDTEVIDIKNKPLILICGPTGVGKSDLAVKLAHSLNGEIISADSIQVYKGLDIGSAKVSKEEMDGIPHYLIDILKPDEEYGVYLFKEKAIEAISKIYSNGHIPIVVGGTAFYIQALLYGIDFTEEKDSDHSYRDELLSSISDEESKLSLYNRLKEIDPVYASSLHFNNVKRVARALEYIHHTGRLFSEYNEEQSKRESDYNFIYFALNDDRDKLYEKINKRVDMMIENGLIDEVKGLLSKGYSRDLNSLSSIGYKEICSYLAGELELRDAVNLIKQNSRHYAKRQLTWLRRYDKIRWINLSEYLASAMVIKEIEEWLNQNQ